MAAHDLEPRIFHRCLDRLGAHSSADIAALSGVTLRDLSKWGRGDCRKLRLAQKLRLVHFLNGGLAQAPSAPPAASRLLSWFSSRAATTTSPPPPALLLGGAEDKGGEEPERDELRVRM